MEARWMKIILPKLKLDRWKSFCLYGSWTNERIYCL